MASFIKCVLPLLERMPGKVVLYVGGGDVPAGSDVDYSLRPDFQTVLTDHPKFHHVFCENLGFRCPPNHD